MSAWHTGGLVRWRYALQPTMSAPPVTSPILCHCWSDADTDTARSVLESICTHGLLLTTNSKTLDTFAIDRGKGVEPMEVWQSARVCFTDIPLELLAQHGARYGRYGIGFKRQTIVEWGGLPAWYLPNHWGGDSLKCCGSTVVNALHAAADAVNHLEVTVREFTKKGIPFEVNYEQGEKIGGEKLAAQLAGNRAALHLVLSFIKEMSPSDTEDYRYVSEREWRIVDGISLTGRGPSCRELTPEEKATLCTRRPAWSEQRQSDDVNIRARFPKAPVIDSFRIFNGLPGGPTVAKLATTILVPNETEAEWVRRFVDDCAPLFGMPPPDVMVFPA